MPVYNYPILDNYIRKIYESLGYEVKPINVSEIYKYGGSVRCLINVLKRSVLKRG